MGVNNNMKICSETQEGDNKVNYGKLWDELKSRGVPDPFEGVSSRAEWLAKRELIKDVLQKEEYGYLPAKPDSVSVKVISSDPGFCAGKAPLEMLMLKAEFGGKEFSFPFCSVVPAGKTNIPAFIHITFRKEVPDKYMPSEEICDNGFAMFSFCYNDVTADNNDFTDGLAGVLFGGRRIDERTGDECGKIAMWAWAAMRVMDYVMTVPCIDKGNVAVAGHSRLGKTALLAGAFDERFAFTFSNNSGCSGAAITRSKVGEKVKDICTRFPFWFCRNYRKYMDNEQEMPFDQHFLLSLAAPRKVYAASAEADSWADPASEYLSCAAASPVYSYWGMRGFIAADRYPEAGDIFHEGNIGYHLRKGRHYFSREDWLRDMEFIKAHMTREL